MSWHTRTPADALREQESDLARGLTRDEAARRLARYGPNELGEGAGRSPLRIVWEQLTATMVLILVGR